MPHVDIDGHQQSNDYVDTSAGQQGWDQHTFNGHAQAAPAENSTSQAIDNSLNFDGPTPWWRGQEDIVISGVAVRMPQSDNIQEFADNLMNGVDMVTEDALRWPPGLYGLPKRHAKIKNYEKMDASFFGVTPKQANVMDPQLRILLEVAYEAILDSGYNPQSLKDYRVGCFVGCSNSEMGTSTTKDPETIVGYSLTGSARSMFANRLSFAFDFQGPSFAVDTACSSSLLALQLAIDAIRHGDCDAALVAGANMTLDPKTSLQFHRLSMLSPQGKCQSFDANGDGYVRAEAIGAFLLQKSSAARRIYCTVVHAKSSTDGFKNEGITYPSGFRQSQLLAEIYREAGVHPKNVKYVECHGTGTKVGDPQEINSICKIFCRDREDPLLIGSVKSNMGHAEPASGIASLAKVLIAMETGVIPANLHFKGPNPNIAGLLDGRLKVVAQKMPLPIGFVGVNSFGFGGSNSHALLKPYNNERTLIEPIQKVTYPKMVFFSGRTQEAVGTMMKLVQSRPDDQYLQALIADHANLPLNMCPYRGYTVLKQSPMHEIMKVPAQERRPIWFVYSGMGSQWSGMGRDLMCIDIFRNTVQRCSDALQPYGLNVMDMIMHGNEETLKSTLNCFTSICAIQIAFTETLKHIGVEPDGIIGHSTGEMVSGYADGCTNIEETMLIGYYRGKAIQESKMPAGAMAAIGLSKEEIIKRAPKGVWVACNNAPDSVTVSGDEDAVLQFVDDLKKESIFAKHVNTAGIAFHSPHLQRAAPAMLEGIKKVIKKPRIRSERWISTSVAEDKWDTDLAKHCSAEYHVNNFTSPVSFYEALQKVPANAVVIEIAPHTLLNAILRRVLPSSSSSFGLMKNGHENNLDFFFQHLGKIHGSGVTINIEKLYPKVPFPVPRGTPMISPLISWDHSQNWDVVKLEDIMSHGSSGSAISFSYQIDPLAQDSKDTFLLDHVIDGRALFPFTGYLVLAWRSVAKSRGLEYENVPIQFENVNVLRATLLSGPTKFNVFVSSVNGDFEIVESDSVCATGRVIMLDETSTPFYYAHLTERDVMSDEESEKIDVLKEDIYKELRLRGYEYGPHFRGLTKMSNTGSRVTLAWTGNWITYLDTLLQASLLAEKADTLRLPVRLRYLRIDPNKHMKSIAKEGDKDVIRALFDHQTQGCIAGGVEMQEIVAQSTQRRSHASGKPTLERVYFCPFTSTECFKQTPQLRNELQAYNALCKRYSLKLAEQIPNLHMAAMEMTTAVDDQALERALADPQCTLIQILHKAINGKSLDQADLSNLEQDKLWGAMWTDFPLKPFLDVIMETQPGHSIRVAAVEPRSIAVPKQIRDMQRTHPLLESEWTLVGVNADTLADEALLEQNAMTAFKFDFDTADATVPDSNKNHDFMVLDRVLHTKMDIAQYLELAKTLLKDDGFVLVNEITDNFETAYAISAMQGQTTAAKGRIYGLFFGHDHWMQVFQQAGYRVIGYQSDTVMNTLYLLRKILSKPRKPVFYDVDDVKEFSWLKPVQDAIEERINALPEEQIWLTSTKVHDNGTVGLGLCLKDELSKTRIHTLMDASVQNPSQLNVKSPQIKGIMENDLHSNIYRDGEWGSFQHIVVKDDQMLAYKETEHAFINTLVRGDLSSLQWVESPNQFWQHTVKSKNTDLCQIYYAALNFRDIMLASGRLPPDAIPGDFTDRDCLLGMEFSGRLSSNGRRIMGLLPAQAMATTAVVSPDFSWDIPDEWTLEEAATVPVVYTTCYYALIVRGHLRKGDKVLIHSGSGGVGLAGIAIALALGAEVFTTVSSEEKKRFVQDRFPQMQDCHFSNSRTTEFEFHIMHETKGKGVDVVLNSLSEDKLQASVRCLAKNGRFLEIGKFDLSNNSNLGMSVFLKNVTFHGILLDSLFGGDDDDWTEVDRLFKDGLTKGVVKPLPSTVFGGDKAEEAFRFMATGKHKGKVLLKLRDEEEQKIVLPKPVKVKAVCRTLCHPQHSYLITGGMGGFGLELAQWLINRGAKKIVLTSRTGVRSGYQARCLLHWKRSGVEVLVSKYNVADEQQTQQLIEQCQELGPLGGVFHLAMVLRDCLFENQTVDNFKEAAEAKYWGTKNLDKYTRQMCSDELKWFAVWSSISCGRGNSGQTNYGWANSTMERIVEKRRADGLAGLAIRWGAVGDVGVILENMGDNNTVVGGTLPQRIPSCLQALDLFLSWDHPIVSSFVRTESETSKNKSKQRDPVQAIAHILGVQDASQLDADTSFGDLGLDSLMGVEIKQALERDYDIVMSMKDIRALTINKLKEIAAGGAATANGASKPKDTEDSSQSSSEDENNEEKEDLHGLFSTLGLRVDLESLKPEKVIVHLNKVTQGRPVFCVPAVGGVAAPLASLATKLPVPVYSVQAVAAAPQDSIEQLASFYAQEIKRIQPQGPYRIIGYSYGACVALELAIQLQQEMGPDAIESLVLLDGSHKYVRNFRNALRAHYGVGDKELDKIAVLFEAEVLCAVIKLIMPIDYEQWRQELTSLPNYQARLDAVVQKLVSSGLPVNADDIKFACDAWCKRFIAADKYDLTKRFKGDVTLIRAKVGTAREEDVGKDFMLNEVTDGKVQVHFVSGDHNTFIQGRNSDKTASIIAGVLRE